MKIKKMYGSAEKIVYLCLSYWPRVYNTSQDIQIRYVLYKEANSCFIDRFNEEPKKLYTQESAAMGKLLEASKNT